jgi:hypothetical protein
MKALQDRVFYKVCAIVNHSGVLVRISTYSVDERPP